MIPSPIPKVLSSIRRHQVRALLMGGQACVLYGAAEFSRDIDLALLAEPDNLTRLREAMAELEASPIAVPPLSIDYLSRGHAAHLRCAAAGVEGVRIDLMSVMRGVAPFPELWARRTTLAIGSDEVDVLSLPDLVQAKKTQRDKDWPMIRRLIEADYFAHRSDPTAARVAFWLEELRSPSLLIELAASEPAAAAASQRAAVHAARRGAADEIERALADEQAAETAADRIWWEPLKRELESIRRSSR
mgnify:CR=1 FL=1